MMPLDRRRSPSGVGPYITLAVIVLVPALVLFALWRFAAGRAADAGSDTLPTTTVPAGPVDESPPLTTPLLSYRRVAPLFLPTADVAGFRGPVADFAATLDGSSCLYVAVDGVEAGSHNPDLPVIPASNQKLLTASAALHTLGRDHTFTTTVAATGLANGVAGDLYLIGGGDPLLHTPDWNGSIIGYPLPDEATDLNALAQSVVAAGVTQVTGRVLGDGSRYDDELYHDEWNDDVRVLEAGPLSALLVNDSRMLDADGEWQTADSPTAGAAAELTRLLRALGVTVAGEPGSATAPADATTVASIQSAPLPVVVAEMLATSDNNTAELLVKELGVHSGGAGTTEAGTAVMGRSLQEQGIDTSQFVIADGSGLSNDNRVTCRGMTDVLRLHSVGDDLASGLPVAAESGTLSDNFVDTPVAGVLIGKTGSLSNPPFNDDVPSVKSLSGYVPIEEGGTIQFSLILNSPTVDYAQIVNNEPIWTALAGLLGSYTPTGPTAAQLGPVTG
jgi:D-alanyl-D-alanine carboxypeptidase/D-alanyl-D-alanine-endopeptidase (penicillin-binding protein 4)